MKPPAPTVLQMVQAVLDEQRDRVAPALLDLKSRSRDLGYLLAGVPEAGTGVVSLGERTVIDSHTDEDLRQAIVVVRAMLAALPPEDDADRVIAAGLKVGVSAWIAALEHDAGAPS